jgi:hypothetical protein
MIELHSPPTPNGRTKAAEGKSAINMFDTKDNAERLAKATKA